MGNWRIIRRVVLVGRGRIIKYHFDRIRGHAEAATCASVKADAGILLPAQVI